MIGFKLGKTNPHKCRYPDQFRPILLNLLNNYRPSRHPEAPRVPATKYFYIEANRIKGGISCRWKLNDYLLKFGGNIGYGVAPEFRNQGIASEMLQQALALFKARNITKVLITAEDWNIASQQVINNAGGIYENTLMEESTGHHLQRYWITLK